MRGALLAGKSVVTANKQVIAHHGPALLTLAERQGRQLRFEAAVGGAMPIVRALGDGLAGERVTRIDAILNGTSNAVLSQMDAIGCAIDEAIADACARGYAEADPSADLDGARRRGEAGDPVRAGVRPARRCPSQIETRTARRSCGPTTSARRGSAAARSARSRTPSTTATGRALTAWVAPIFVPRGVGLRAGDRARRTPRSSPARTRARSR